MAPMGAERPVAYSPEFLFLGLPPPIPGPVCSTEEKVGSQQCSPLALLFQGYHLDKDKYPNNNNVTQKRAYSAPCTGGSTSHEPLHFIFTAA